MAVSLLPDTKFPSMRPSALCSAKMPYSALPTYVPLLTAKSVVFDMSDGQPPAFGGTAGQGEWGLFQKFLQSPSNVTGIQQQLESAATAAYKK